MFTKDERLLYAYTYMQFQQKDLLLDFWQDAYIRSMARFIAIVKSRRVGWSFICSLKGLIKAMDPERIGYTKQLEEHVINKINESEIVKKQLENEDIDVFSNCIMFLQKKKELVH